MLGNAENDEVPGIFHLGHEMSKCPTSGGGVKISGRSVGAGMQILPSRGMEHSFSLRT